MVIAPALPPLALVPAPPAVPGSEPPVPPWERPASAWELPPELPVSVPEPFVALEPPFDVLGPPVAFEPALAAGEPGSVSSSEPEHATVPRSARRAQALRHEAPRFGIRAPGGSIALRSLDRARSRLGTASCRRSWRTGWACRGSRPQR